MWLELLDILDRVLYELVVSVRAFAEVFALNESRAPADLRVTTSTSEQVCFYQAHFWDCVGGIVRSFDVSRRMSKANRQQDLVSSLSNCGVRRLAGNSQLLTSSPGSVGRVAPKCEVDTLKKGPAVLLLQVVRVRDI